MWSCSPWALLPLLYSVSTAAGLCVVYFVAVHQGSVRPLGSPSRTRTNGSLYPPYISVAGNFPPASCIFSEVMNLAAFMGVVISVLRYLQLRPVISKRWLNVISLSTFCIAGLGMTLVGNFQVFTEEMIHNIGTMMTFGLGTVFCWVQSYITLRVNLRNEGRPVAIVRFLLSGSITACMVPYFALMSQRLHTEAAQCQWALVMFFLIFIATFAIEFRHCSFQLTCSDVSQRPIGWSEMAEDSRPQLDEL